MDVSGFVFQFKFYPIPSAALYSMGPYGWDNVCGLFS